MTIIGSAHVQVRADDKYFESDVRKAAAKIRNVNIQLKADVDLTKASKKIRDLRYRITSKDAVLKVDANVTKAEEKLARLLAKFTKNDLEFKAVANTRGAETELAKLRTRYATNRVNITAEADTRAANAQLALAARRRNATISATIDPQTRAALAGLFNVITGTISAVKIKAAVTGLAANFEGLAVKATIATTAILALSASGLTLGANILSIGGDITQAVGLVALFPTAIGSMITSMVAGKMAWTGFADAMSSDTKKAAKALAELPPEAQKAALALKGVYTQIQKPVQKAFWEVMGTSLQDTVKNLLPSLKEGLSAVGKSLGSVTREVVLAFDRMGDGTLLNMLQNLGKGLENMAPGFGALIDSFSILGEVGSTYLPRFGEWTTELAVRFKNFIEEAEKTGKINEWIDTGVQRLKEMGSIVKSTAGFFSGLTQAARLAGAPGLTEMAEGMRNLRDIVNGEPFQSRLIMVLEGARSGVEKLSAGFGNLTSFIGDSSQSLGIFLDEAGTIAGLAFDNIRGLFDGTGLGTGLYAALQGLKDLMVIMKPGVQDLGTALGSLGRIAGEVARNLGPGLNQLFETISGVLLRLEDGIVKVIPIFNEFIQNILGAVQGPIFALADGLGAILEGFTNLPGPIQALVMSLALVVAIGPKFLGMFDGLKDRLRDTDTRGGRAFQTILTGFDKVGNASHTVSNGLSTFGKDARNVFTTTGEGLKKSMGNAFDALPSRAQNAVRGIQGAFKEFGSGFSSGLNMTREFDTVRTGLTNVADRTRDTFRSMATDIRGQFQRFGEFVVPANSAVRTFAGQVQQNLGPARQAMSDLTRHAVTSTTTAVRQIGSGLGTAFSGLTSALGGPWGIAIAAGTILLTEFAASSGKTKQQVDSLAQALEQSSGRIDGAATKIIASNLQMKDSFLWMEQDSAFDLANKLGVPLDDVVDAASGVPGAFKRVNDALKATGKETSTTGTTIRSMNDTMKGQGGLFGTLVSLADKSGLFYTESDKLNEKITEQKKILDDARKKNEELAKSLSIGTVAAARLTENYDTLADASATVSSKVSAMRENFDLLNSGALTGRNAARDHAKSLFDLDDALKNLAGSGKEIIDVNGRMDDSFRNTLTLADGTFTNTSRAAISFSEEMDGAAKNVIELGLSEMKKLQDAGVKLPEAQGKALEVMNGATQKLRDKLLTVGFDAGQAQLIISQLGLNPEQLQGALVLDTKDAEGAAARFELFMSAIKSGNWEVALTASSDSIKEEILKTEVYKQAYEKGGWNAVIGVIDEAGPKIGEFMGNLAQIKEGDKAKVRAVIEAEAPGAKVIQQATQDLEVFNKTNPVEKALVAQDQLSVPAGIARKGLEEFNQLTPFDKYFKAIDQTGDAKKTATENMTTPLPDGFGKFFGTDKTKEGRDSAQATMNTLNDVWRDAMANNKAGPGIASAQGTFESLKSVTRDAIANNAAGPGVSSANQTMGLFKSKTVDASVNDKASGVISDINRQQIANKTFSITGILSGLSDAARRILGLAHGGILDGGVQTFANGGIKMPQVKTYANGGTENHVAQIARGAWPVRVWAEPETGGEAYVPLHPSKRKRSLQILEEVATLFGYSLTKAVKFADGGFMNSSRTPSSLSVSASSSYVSSAAAATAGPTTIINTTINPSQGLNERQIGEAAATGIYWQLNH